jgi:hypothetical protein
VGTVKASADGAECRHDPDPGTAYTTTGLPVDLRFEQDAPVDALCLNCGQWIRCDRYAPSGSTPAWRLKYPERSCAR